MSDGRPAECTQASQPAFLRRNDQRYLTDSPKSQSRKKYWKTDDQRTDIWTGRAHLGRGVEFDVGLKLLLDKT